jgi:hypothetical protein
MTQQQHDYLVAHASQNIAQAEVEIAQYMTILDAKELLEGVMLDLAPIVEQIALILWDGTRQLSTEEYISRRWETIKCFKKTLTSLEDGTHPACESICNAIVD